MAKKNPPTNKRSDWAYVEVNNTKGQLSFTYDSASETIVFDEQVQGSAKFVRSYERASGKDKVVMEIPCPTGPASFDSSTAIFSNFHHLLAIDTNTKKYDGAWVSITVAVGVPAELKNYAKEIPFAFLDAYLVARRNLDGNSEAFGWHQILSRSINAVYFSGGKRAGVIVDSKLGELPRINSLKIPYFGNHLLPTNVQLLYASDAMADAVPNQMIRMCDSTASALFKRMVETKMALPPSAFIEPIQVQISPRSVTVHTLLDEMRRKGRADLGRV